MVSKKNLLYFKNLDAEGIIIFNENYNNFFYNALNTITSNTLFQFRVFIGDDESNICSIEPKDTWEDLSAFLERVKNSI